MGLLNVKAEIGYHFRLWSDIFGLGCLAVRFVDIPAICLLILC